MIATRHLLALSAAAGACGLCGPVLAQDLPPPQNPQAAYEYAVPTQGDVVFQADPMVQPIGAPALPPPPAPPAPPSVEWHHAPLPEGHMSAHESPPPQYAGGPMVQPRHSYPASASPYGTAAPGPRFDRQAWLADCRERTRSIRNADERARVIGALLGAAGGGLIGNRVYDSERLAGTLIGAGVGGLAGLAIGAAVDAVSNRKRGDDCAFYLDRTTMDGHRRPELAYGFPGYAGYPGPVGGYGYGYGYGYGQGYGAVAYVPVLVAVPQRQVVRETVTEEWVDEPVRSRTISKRRAAEPTSAPRRDKRIKIIKR